MVNHGHSRAHHRASHLRRPSSERRVNDLCKQGVRGSSPLSSTRQNAFIPDHTHRRRAINVPFGLVDCRPSAAAAGPVRWCLAGRWPDQAAPLRGAGSGAPRAGLWPWRPRPARPRRPTRSDPMILLAPGIAPPAQTGGFRQCPPQMSSSYARQRPVRPGLATPRLPGQERAETAAGAGPGHRARSARSLSG